MSIPDSLKSKLKIDRTKARQALLNDPELGIITDLEIDNALATMNQDTFYDTERNKLSAVVWDRISPINGVAAQYFLNRDDVDENGTDDIYLLLRNDQVVGFQPHDPELPGLVRIPKGQGKIRGNNQADKVAAERTIVEVIRLIREKILTNRAVL